jgi:dipeptidyl aminopeptidase/acylaminoacyl peptidase
MAFSAAPRLACATMLALTLLSPAVAAPKPVTAKSHEGTLDASIDTESADVGVRLKAMEQEQYGIEEYLYLILFNQQYGTRIAAERLTIPTVDAGVEPAYVFSPRVLKPGANYPGLVMVHGSYHGALDPAIFATIAAAVDHGYIVIFPEYRGSRGYGQAQYDAIDFGGKEVDDIIAAADYLAAARPVKKDNIAIYGRSKGGMIVPLAIERFPGRFAAAVDVVGIADMVAYMAYKPGFRGSDVAKQPRFGGKSIAQDAGPYIDVSPLNHVEDIKTPILVLNTTGDKTAPVQLHGGRLIELLKAHNKVFESKIYDNAPGGHIFAEVDSPEARDSEQRIFEFLAKYLHPQAAP